MGPIYKISYDTHTHQFNGPLSESARVSWYQKGKTNLDITEARDSEWQWHQLGHMQVCTSVTMPAPHHSVFSCRPTNSVKALKALKVQKRKTKMCKQTCSEASVTVTSTAVCVCVFQLIKHWELFLPEAKSVV